MKIEQIYTGCLAQGAYYIESKGEVAIIDPLREVQPYLDKAQKDKATIKYIFETHFHADFVSGHIDLAKKTGASIIYGPTAQPAFDATIATDGQVFQLGDITIKVLHTPGHTMESSCFLLFDENGKEYCLFSGDTLFLGDVGRPDLAQKAAHLTQEELAGLLYDSLMNKIMPLPDNLIVYPAHGAGSACGKNMMKETFDTLGNQKQVNYALRQNDKEHFIAAVLDGLATPPRYFGMNVAMNKGGYNDIDSVLKSGLTALDSQMFEQIAETTDALILDVRSAEVFGKAFIPRSINIGLDGQFAPWVGALVADVKHPLLIVADSGREEETVKRLARVGFDNVLGYLDGGIEAWKKDGKETDSVDRISAEAFKSEWMSNKNTVLDVRRDGEYGAEHVTDAFNRPLDYIHEWFMNVDDSQPFYIHCAGGYRSMIAASILKSKGIHNFKEVAGGFKAIAEAGVPVTDFVCPSKILTN